MSRPLFAGGSARQTSSGGFSIRHVLIRLFVAIRRFPGGHSSYDAARPTGATGPHPWASYPAVTGAAGETPVRRDESADDVWAEYSQLRVELAQEGHDFVEVVTAAEGHRND
jgi:hypothetical protein